MRVGWLGGIAAVLVVVLGVGETRGALSVNGRVVPVLPSLRYEAGEIWAPALAVSPELGVDLWLHDGRWSARWGGGWGDLFPWEIQDVEGVSYVALDGLVRRVGGVLRPSAGGADIEVPAARLIEVGLDGEDLELRFSRFVPAIATDSEGTFALRFPNCGLGIAEVQIAFGPGGVATATLVEGGGAGCELRVAFREVADLSARSREADGAYTLALSATDAPIDVRTVVAGSGIAFGEARRTVNEASIEAAWVVVDDWRGRFRVHPLLPPAGVGTTSSLDAAMSGSGFVAALAAGREPGLIVVDGVPFSLGRPGDPALGFDLFDAMAVLDPSATAWAASDLARIALDGVNRPIGEDEVVAYPAGYTGRISTRSGGNFCVVRARDGEVLSVLDVAFVVADPTATLVVASGAARERIEWLSAGAPLRLACDVDPQRRLVSDAVSMDGVLLWDGAPLPGAREAATTWSLAGVDWQGGFFLMRVASASDVSEADVLEALTDLPTPARDVVILERGGVASLALDVGELHPRWGSDEPLSVALGVSPE